jgi:hypothetical protein
METVFYLLIPTKVYTSKNSGFYDNPDAILVTPHMMLCSGREASQHFTGT